MAAASRQEAEPSESHVHMKRRQRKLVVRKDDGVAQFEQYLKDPYLDQYVLKLPNDIRESGSIGRSASLTQLILTWSKRSENPSTETYLEPDDVSKYEKFVSRLHGFAATYFSHRVTGQSSDKDIRDDLLTQASPRIKAMSSKQLEKTSRGRNIEFVFVKGARNEFHNVFYTQTPQYLNLLDRQYHGQLIVSAKEMDSFLTACLEHLQVQWRTSRVETLKNYFYQPEEGDFGVLLYETFRNTAEHAYLKRDGTMPDKNLRCFMISVQQVSRNQFNESNILSIKRPEARKYFDEVSQLSSAYERKNIQLLEMSIFDSGPGFAATIATPTDATDDDIALVARCFRKHQTAKLGSGSGTGLFRVLESVKELGGFIRFRTSTTESFFASSECFDPEMDPRFYISGELAHVEGTVLTVGIPLVF